MKLSSRNDADLALAREPYARLTVGSHRLSLLRDGAQAFPAMLESIASATRYVCLEAYTIRDDHTGRRFAQALQERARAGVEVSLLYDAWGSSLSSAYLAGLHEAGVRTAAYHPIHLAPRLARLVSRIWRRDHRKGLVVDGRDGFVGGINIADPYASPQDGGEGWRDTALRIEGPAILEQLLLFRRTWLRAGGAPFDEPRYRHDPRRPEAQVRIVGNDLRHARRALARAYLHAVRASTRRAWLTNAYFLPPRLIGRALRGAARRGVDVRVIVAGTTDVPPVLLASRASYPRLLRAGVRIFEWRGRVLHAKTAVMDGRLCTVGSTNLDTLSWRVNLEANAFVEDERLGAAMERMFEEDLPSCHEVTLEEWKSRPLWERLTWRVASWFRRWL